MSEQRLPAGVTRIHERATEEIRVMLARRRMSAADLARRIGTKPQVLSRRMTGDVAFDLDELQMIARELGVSVTELLGESGQDSQASGQYRRAVLSASLLADQPIPHQMYGPPTAAAAESASRRPCRVAGAPPPDTRPNGAEVVPV